MTAEPTPSVQSIVARLGRLRTRIRAIFAAIGIARWLVAALGVLALYFLADWLLDLPLSVRQFVRLGLLQPPAGMSAFLLIPLLALCAALAVVLTRAGHGAAPFFAFVAAGIVGLLAWLAVRLLFPLRVRLPDQELALSVESRFRELKDRLAAALDFEKELAHPTRGESPAMMRAVVVEASQAARDLQFSRAVSGARAVRWGGLALLAVLGAVVVVALFGETVGLWARRSLLLADVDWPRSTTLLAVDLDAEGRATPHDPAIAYDVPIGRSFTVYAQAQGDEPGSALVLDVIPGQAPLARRMFAVPGHEGLFAYEFRDVRRPFAFFVQGGDDEDEKPVYRIEITIPPRVLDIQSTITYPDYLGLAEETVPDGSVTVPEGARVAVAFRADVDIAQASAVLGEVTIPAVPLPDGADRGFGFAYTAERSASIRLVMRTSDGKTNDAAADTYQLRVKPDQPPRVNWVYPRASLEVTPGGRVPLLAYAQDDHGIAELVLEMRVNAEAVQRFPLRAYGTAATEGEDTGPPRDANDGAYGRQRVASYLPLEIGALRDAEGKPLAAPTQLAFRLVARDSRGQVRESEQARVDVGDPASLERALATQRANVRLGIDAVRRDQRARREEVAALLAGPMDRAELDLLKTIRFSQGRIAQDADQRMQELFGVFNAFVYDRLGAENPNAKILGLLDAHHRATYGREADRTSGAGEAAARAALAGREWLGDPVFPYAVYRQIVDAWRDKVIYDKGLLDKMCAVVATATGIGSRLAPRAHALAADAVTGAEDDVRALLAAQDANLAALDALLEAMAGWQSLSDMTQLLRGIIDEQETLIRQMDGKDASGAGGDDAGSGR